MVNLKSHECAYEFDEAPYTGAVYECKPELIQPTLIDGQLHYCYTITRTPIKCEYGANSFVRENATMRVVWLTNDELDKMYHDPRKIYRGDEEE